MREGAATKPELAAVINAANPAPLRANFEAFSHEPGLHAELAGVGVPMFMYAGTADPWHNPMRTFAERTDTGFFSLPDADHVGCWGRSADVLARVLPFLTGDPPSLTSRGPPAAIPPSSVMYLPVVAC